MSRAAILGAALVLLGAGAALFFLQAPDAERGERALPPESPGVGTRPAPTEPPSRTAAPAAPSVPRPLERPEASTPPSAETLEASLLDLAQQVARASAAEDERALERARAEAQQVRTRLIETLRRDGAAAERLLGRLASAEASAALALAAVLRFVPDAAVGRRLATLATSGAEAHHRQAAVQALEGRDASLWFEPVRQGFRADASADVRTDAARVLSRSLRDPSFAAHHTRVREALLAGLSDADPRQRERAAEAFAIDRDAPAAVRERLQALATSDPDARARAAAASAVRALAR